MFISMMHYSSMTLLSVQQVRSLMHLLQLILPWASHRPIVLHQQMRSQRLITTLQQEKLISLLPQALSILQVTILHQLSTWKYLQAQEKLPLRKAIQMYSYIMDQQMRRR
jgi:hypothetical protein